MDLQSDSCHIYGTVYVPARWSDWRECWFIDQNVGLKITPQCNIQYSIQYYGHIYRRVSFSKMGKGGKTILTKKVWGGGGKGSVCNSAPTGLGACSPIQFLNIYEEMTRFLVLI